MEQMTFQDRAVSLNEALERYRVHADLQEWPQALEAVEEAMRLNPYQEFREALKAMRTLCIDNIPVSPWERFRFAWRNGRTIKARALQSA